MPSHLDALQRPGPVNFRRFLGNLHGVGKQASFNVVFKKDFKGFRRDFGRFWEAKMNVKIDFFNVFSAVFFNMKKIEFLTYSVLKDSSERVQGRFWDDFFMVLD